MILMPVSHLYYIFQKKGKHFMNQHYQHSQQNQQYAFSRPHDGHRSLQRLHLYEKERIAQEEYRLQHDIMRCQSDAAGLYTQIEVLDFELSLLCV
jgi:hypothetical protein